MSPVTFAALDFPAVMTTTVFTSHPLEGVGRKAYKVLEEKHRAAFFKRNIFFLKQRTFGKLDLRVAECGMVVSGIRTLNIVLALQESSVWL